MGIENKVKYKYFILANFLTKKNANNTKYYNLCISGVTERHAIGLIQLRLGIIKGNGIALAAR